MSNRGRIFHEEDRMGRQGKAELLGMTMIIQTDAEDRGRRKRCQEFFDPDRGSGSLQTVKKISLQEIGHTFLPGRSVANPALFIEKTDDFHGTNFMPSGREKSIKIKKGSDQKEKGVKSAFGFSLNKSQKHDSFFLF